MPSAAEPISIAHGFDHRSAATKRSNRQQKEAAPLGALTIIAHDFRGPLANLSVLIDRLEMQADTGSEDSARVAADAARATIDALDGMLNGFLQRTRETGDPLSFHPAMVDLAEVVADAAEVNRPLAGSRGITIDCSGVSSVIASGDRRLLTQAVLNLIGNAVKYAPPRSTIKCETMRSGNDAVIAIADEGQGLSELDMKRAFRPFTTLSAPLAGRPASWGLGLWIVRLIAERHGGRVTVSGKSAGAKFALHLPCTFY